MASHGQGFSLARKPNHAPASHLQNTADSKAHSVKATRPARAQPVRGETAMMAAPSATSAPGLELPGFRHMLEASGVVPFKVYGEEVVLPGPANDRMRELMAKLALRMNFDFSFEHDLPNAANNLDNPSSD